MKNVLEYLEETVLKNPTNPFIKEIFKQSLKIKMKIK